MALGQVMLPAVAPGNGISALMFSGGGDQCSGIMAASEFRNASVRHSVNGCFLHGNNNFKAVERSINSFSLRPRASGQPPFNPLQYQSYSVPSLNWRNKGVKRLIQGYKEQEAMQRGRPVEFSESTIASLFSEHAGTC